MPRYFVYIRNVMHIAQMICNDNLVTGMRRAERDLPIGGIHSGSA
jgi:hypothetical protein